MFEEIRSMRMRYYRMSPKHVENELATPSTIDAIRMHSTHRDFVPTQHDTKYVIVSDL